ncbi:MAG TPA: sulfotransferase [Solirubrobacteraceae bacterium]|jgi:hypothetical protein|nr:sulfotransferase [Solirubrobacteraceae bacterium]
MTASIEPSVRVPTVSDRYPDFFIVGHAKSGTTALYEMLRRHPQIYMPGVKEPQFFARNWAPSGERSGRAHFEQTGRRAQTVEEYLALFAAARPDQRVGEASTFYLWSVPAPARIAAVQPGARIIAVLREPASFLRSLHLQMVQNNAESEKDLRQALELEGPRRQGRKIPSTAHWPQALIYSDRVRYVEQLRRYHEAFGRQQVLVLIYDDFKSDNEGTVRRVLRFLDVDETVPLSRVQANPTLAVRSPRIHRMTRAARAGRGPLSGAVRSTVRALTTAQTRKRVLYPLRRTVVFGEPPPADEALMGELRERFRDEVVALGSYLERDLVTLWGYDRDP